MAVPWNPLEYPVALRRPRRLTPFSAWHEHIPFAMLVTEFLQPKMFVELGTHYGDSYCAFCEAVSSLALDTRCFAVDTWAGDEQTGYYDEDVLLDLRSHHDPLYGSFSRLLRETFDEALAHFDDETIDLLHIDGCHTYESVRHDFDAWLPKMSTRGVVLLHDTNVRMDDFGVWRLWQEVSEEYPHFEFLHGNGLGVVATGADVPTALAPLFKLSPRETEVIREYFFEFGHRLTLHAHLSAQAAAVEAKNRELDELRTHVHEARAETDERERFLTDQLNHERQAAEALARRFADMEAKDVLLIAPDVLPAEGLSTTGAGLRAWGIGQGLRARGHRVTFAMPHDVAGRTGYRGGEIELYDPEQLDDFIGSNRPDVVVFQHWSMVGRLTRKPDARLVIDLHGPLLLETLFRDETVVAQLAGIKMRALAFADYFTCAGVTQRFYYLGQLLLAGHDIRDRILDVVPFSLDPDLPTKGDWPTPPRFVYGGVFLPWQDPLLGLDVLVRELDRRGEGDLQFFGGDHPWLTLAPDSRFDEMRSRLGASPHVVFNQRMGRADLVDRYREATVAWDLMARNPERELAFTSRTVEYMWCGLPVVYNDYAELAQYIRAYDAGWTVDAADEGAILEVVREIFDRPDLVAQKGTNAQRLVRERLVWDRTIAPLHDFCRGAIPGARRLSEFPLVLGTTEVLSSDARITSAHVLDGAPMSIVVSPEMAFAIRVMRRVTPRRLRGVIRSALGTMRRVIRRFRFSTTEAH